MIIPLALCFAASAMIDLTTKMGPQRGTSTVALSSREAFLEAQTRAQPSRCSTAPFSRFVRSQRDKAATGSRGSAATAHDANSLSRACRCLQPTLRG